MIRSRQFVRKTNFVPTKKLFILATEGTETEPLYFDQFKPTRYSSIRIKILPPIKHKSNPASVFKRLQVYAKEHNLGNGDELWLIIDRDKWDANLLDQIAAKCNYSNLYLALSNPCFEFWLYLHLAEPRPFSNATECGKALSKILHGYEKSNYDLDRLKSCIPYAIKRAHELNKKETHSWPREYGTTVYILVNKLISP